MDFDNGSLSIAVFNALLTNSTIHAHFIYDHTNTTNANHFENLTNYVSALLEAASVDDNNVAHMFVITWRGYTYCEANVSEYLK